MKVKKLTPATLKRIIAEEKYKLKTAAIRKKSSSKKVTRKKLVETYLNLLKQLDSKQRKNQNSIKKINEAKKLIKVALLKRIK
mgnify:CR=1 FL=1|tara:strand:- start:68 stop:316 length:249 start_codon:yes stop_codon:yes gene_type:complete